MGHRSWMLVEATDGDRRSAPLAYAAVAALSIVAAIFTLRLWRADLRIPFDYDGDALLFSYLVKSLCDHGWIWNNPTVGAPSGFHLQDYAVSAHDTGHLAVIKLMSLFTGDWALLFNLYFLLGFPLIALASLAVLRHFRVSFFPALACSVLYAFLPSRLLVAEGHLFLDVFFQVPLAVLLLLWTCGDDPPLSRDRAGSPWPAFDLRRRRSLVALAICLLLASTSSYYAFFTICLLAAGSAWASWERRSRRNVLSGFALIGAIVVGLFVNGLPSIAYHHRHGPNPHVGERFSREAEVYGLKITQLLLPVPEHRLPPLAQIKRAYDATAPLNGESATTSLGTAGAAGFLLLLGVIIARRKPSWAPEELLRPLAVLTLLAVLLGTIGGFGSLLAYLLTPQIRTYARLNAFIGFFALFAIALLLDRVARRSPNGARVAAAAVLGLGLLDQATPAAVRDYAATKRTYQSDGAFVHQQEAQLPAGAAIFQLPFSPFPEPPDVHAMPAYAQLRPYLHSRTLRWSYPAMLGRGGDAWTRAVAQRDPPGMLAALSDADFAGILLDRRGYEDRGAALEAALRPLLAIEAESPDGHLAFFPLANYKRARDAGQSPEQQARNRDQALHPLGVILGDGFYELERGPTHTFRWARAHSELWIENESSVPRRISLSMTLAAAQAPAHLHVRGDILNIDLDLPPGGTRFTPSADVPPGHHAIRFDCDGRRLDAPIDPRSLVWTLADFSFEDVVSNAPTAAR